MKLIGAFLQLLVANAPKNRGCIKPDTADGNTGFKWKTRLTRDYCNLSYEVNDPQSIGKNIKIVCFTIWVAAIQSRSGTEQNGGSFHKDESDPKHIS
jgi:hypothetical protein